MRPTAGLLMLIYLAVVGIRDGQLRNLDTVLLGDLVSLNTEDIPGEIERENQRYSLLVNWEYIGTDAMRTLLAHLIDDLGHHRITIDPAADNEPAIRCYERVGFRLEGTLRESRRHGDEWWDTCIMALLHPGRGPAAIMGQIARPASPEKK